jgi:hypothetical protein
VENQNYQTSIANRLKYLEVATKILLSNSGSDCNSNRTELGILCKSFLSVAQLV